MHNEYLKDRAMRRNYRRGTNGRSSRDYESDMRNPYGSKGGYVRSRRGRDRGMDSEYTYPEYDSRYDYGYDSRYSDSRDYMGDEHYGEYHRPMEYEMYGIGGMRPMYDYRDYAEEKEHKEYQEKLNEWISKLKKKDKFNLPKEEVFKKAKEMGIKFEKYDEMEFYAVYLMLVSDFKQISSEPHRYIAMAKEWLEDDDIKRRGSDKVCAYLYSIVLGEDE